jgi:hypothetical protein
LPLCHQQCQERVDVDAVFLPQLLACHRITLTRHECHLLNSLLKLLPPVNNMATWHGIAMWCGIKLWLLWYGIVLAWNGVEWRGRVKRIPSLLAPFHQLVRIPFHWPHWDIQIAVVTLTVSLRHSSAVNQ